MYEVKRFRPLPDSGIDGFGEWLESANWDELVNAESTSEQVKNVQAAFSDKKKLDTNLPQKTARFTNKDKPYITCELKTLDRKKKKEYAKND